MSTESVLLKVEGDGISGAIDRVTGELDAAGGELLLDVSAIQRLASTGLRAVENLVQSAEQKAVKVSLRNVNVAVYKVLKLTKLSQRLCFVD